MNATTRERRRAGFRPGGFLWRWLASLVLVLATYNPSGFSYVHWVRAAISGDGIGAAHVLVGLLGLSGWAILLVATHRSLGSLGTLLAGLTLAALIWWLADLGLIGAQTPKGVVWLALVALATVLAVGLSWSHLWRRLTGQYEVDEG